MGLFGAAIDTGNMGVSALAVSALLGLRGVRRFDITLFDHGQGERPFRLRTPDGETNLLRVGCAHSKRFYRSGNLGTMLASAHLGLRGVHPMLRRLDGLDAILDVSAGDSFTDLYGSWRFRAVALPKRIALALRRPLFLLPQTYGPFRDARRAEAARRILRGVRQAWARDARSLELVRELLGADFDPERHRTAVDLAFGLPALEPVSNAVVESVMSTRAGASVVLGLNVSGLLWHAPGEASSTFALRGSYRDLVREILQTLLAVSGARVVLVPHVVPPCDVLESDVSACEALRGELPADAAERVAVAPALANPTEVKWVIGQTDWFCGTRMHACIAALSQGIPTAGIAYSDKALGVFESVGAGEWLLDARAPDSGKIAERVAESLLRRAETAVGLRAALPGVRRTLDEALRAIAAAIP